MTVGSFCNRTVVICRESDSILESARRMRDFDVGSLVVVEDRNGVRVPVGIVTDRDIMLDLAEADHIAARTRLVGDVMSRGVVTAREDESLDDGLKRMRAYGVRRLPVVNAEGGLEGLVTFDDLLGLFAEELTDMTRLLTREKHWHEGAHGRPL
jgi:CBS domain-containing protein